MNEIAAVQAACRYSLRALAECCLCITVSSSGESDRNARRHARVLKDSRAFRAFRALNAPHVRARIVRGRRSNCRASRDGDARVATSHL
jgi:hypothetical protein